MTQLDSPHINTETMHYMGVILLSVVEFMWVERSGACEPTGQLLTREVVGREQILQFLKMIGMQVVVFENMPYVDVASYT